MRLGVAIATWILLATAPVAHAQPDSAKPAPAKPATAPPAATQPAPAQPASAKPAAAATARRPPTPWSKGVSAAAQDRALRLFQRGNQFLEQKRYTEAVAQYEPALASWDNPSIRFNMAICLLNMRQPLAAWEHLRQALRFGDAPLTKRLYAEAMTYVAVLEASLAQLTVKSLQPGVTVMVDGGQVLSDSGEHTLKLLAGKHQLVATRAGYITQTRALDLAAGKSVTEEISLLPETVKIEVQRENYERRWRWWVPWSVAGGSVGLGLVGSAVYLTARSDMRRYDDAVAQMCPQGCSDADIPAPLRRLEGSARRNSGFAIGLWTAAGAFAITGGVMAILNRPRKQEQRVAVPSLTVSRDYVGVGLSLTLE